MLNAVCASWPTSSIKNLKRFAAMLRDKLEVPCLEDQVTRGIEASQQLRLDDIRRWKAYREHLMFPRTAAQKQPHILKPYVYNASAAGSLCDFTNTLLHTITKRYPNTIEQFYNASLRRFKLLAFHPMPRSALVIWREDITLLVRPVRCKYEPGLTKPSAAAARTAHPTKSYSGVKSRSGSSMRSRPIAHGLNFWLSSPSKRRHTIS